MGLLALAAAGVISWILRRSTWLMLHMHLRKITLAVSLIPLLFYTVIAGFNIPVFRALLMTMIFMLAIFFDRPGNLINHILLAGLIILIWNPAVLFEASFQLSFSAVLAIALIYPLLHALLFPGENRTDIAPQGSELSVKRFRHA